MLRGFWLVGALSSLSLTPCIASTTSLTFDFERHNALDEWHSPTQGAIELDSSHQRSGTSSLRLVNDKASGQPYVMFSRAIEPKSGRFIEVRAFVRSDSVIGSGALWLRQDGKGKPLLFDNMHGRGLSGTSDWQLLSIRQELLPGTEKIVFGGLLSGSGRVWFDDLQLVFDGATAGVPPALDVRAPIPALSGEQASYVSEFIQVWGFLKFHHPAASTGRVNWDGELVRHLTAIAGCKSRPEALRIVSHWVSDLGKPACERCTARQESSATQVLSPPVDWIWDEKRLGSELSKLLVDIYKAKAWTGGQHFVSLAPHVGNVVSTNEVQYAVTSLPAPALRVLAVARIWSSINYWFPYRESVQQPWESVLPTSVAEVIAADSEEAYQRTLLQLLAKVNDGHAVLLSRSDHRPPSGECRVPAVFRAVGSAPTVVSASSRSGLVPGDRLTTLDGESTAALLLDWTSYYSASSSAARLNQLSINITRGDCGASTLSVSRGGKEIVVEAQRTLDPVPQEYLKHDLPGAAYRTLSGNLAYLKLSKARAADIERHLMAASRSNGLIVDLRGYPMELALFELAGRLVDTPTPFAKFSVASLDSPGAFSLTAPIDIEPKEPQFVGKVAVLIDESTISQAEYTAMALRAAGATLIGSASAGADGNVSRVELPGGLKFMFSGIGVFYPDGTATQVVGVIPDVLVAPSIEGVRNCRDEVLEAAVLRLAGVSVSNEAKVSICRNFNSSEP